jgi:hypothetical protein
MAPVVGLAPTRTGLKDRALDSLHSRAIGPGGGICTRTGSVLSGVPLLLGYAGLVIDNGTPGRTFACNLRVRSAVLYTLSYGS